MLGPSHHVYIEGCALSVAKTIATPFGNIPVDTETIAKLRATHGSLFSQLSLEEEEEEHSLEMHFPYIAKSLDMKKIKLVPIMVGHLGTFGAQYGAAFAPYLLDESTFFVTSSDFCHWYANYASE